MVDWLDRLAATLLDASLAATAITGLVILAMLQCRQPARRQSWARAGVLSTLGLLPLAALNPVPRIDVRGPISSLVANVFDDPAWLLPGSNATPARDGVEPCHDAGHGTRTGLQRFGRAVAVAYLIGLAIGLGRLLVGLVGVVLLVHQATIPSDRSLGLYESLPLSRRAIRPRLLVSEQTTRPVLIRSIAPVILIPPDLDDPAASTGPLRLSLLHELAHVENLDHRFSVVESLAEAVWFFLPACWWIRDQLKLDREFLADRRAADHFGTSGHYASSLVDFASTTASISREADEAANSRHSPTTMTGVASALFQRVQMLLKCPFPIEGETPLWWRWSTTLTLGLATLAASCLTIRGLDGWGDSTPLPITEARQTFRLPQLLVAPGDSQKKPFEFPYRLPAEFTLTLEVMAEPSDLPSLEILGHKLGTTAGADLGREVYRIWHRVRIRRIRGFDFVEVDGRSLPFSAVPAAPSPWLVITPLADQPTRIRELTLDW